MVNPRSQVEQTCFFLPLEVPDDWEEGCAIGD